MPRKGSILAASACPSSGSEKQKGSASYINSIYHPTPPDVASKLLMRLEVVAPDITHSEFAPLFLSGGSIQLSVPLPCRMRHMKKVQQRFRNGFRSIADVANFHKISAEGRKIKEAQ